MLKLFYVILMFSIVKLGVSQNPDSLISFEDLKEEMLQTNPHLLSFENLVAAAKERIPQAGSLPDPRLNFGLMNLPVDTYNFNQEPMTQKTIGISQSIPFFGKLSFSEQLSEKMFEMQNKQYMNLKLQKINILEKLYFDLYFNHHSILLMRKNRQILNDFVSVTTIKYKTGKGIQQDVLKSQVELLKIHQKLIELNQVNKSLKSKINNLIDRAPQRPLGKPGELEIPVLQVSIEDLQNIALQNNPTFAASKINVDKNQISHKLAKRDYWPDITLNLNYGQRENRPDFLSGLISVNIPLYAGSKQARKVQEAALNISAAQHELQSMQNDIYLAVKILSDELEKVMALLHLYRNEIIPQAQSALESAIASYQTDKIDFITLLNNQLTLLNYETEYFRLVSEYRKHLANLMKVCGAENISIFKQT